MLSTKDTIGNNMARQDGGGVCQGDTDDAVSLVNALILNNRAGANGGGVCGNDYGRIEIVNTTISGNEAVFGGGCYIGGQLWGISGSKECTFVNTILWGNVGSDGNPVALNNNPSEVYLQQIHLPRYQPLFTHCDVRGGCQAFAGPGAGGYNAAVYYMPHSNIDADPLFLEEYTLNFGSPCINRGMNAMPAGIALPQTDLAGRTRIQNGVVDIGAYEVPLILVPVPPPVGLAH
jgi:hypothetical protein